MATFILEYLHQYLILICELYEDSMSVFVSLLYVLPFSVPWNSSIYDVITIRFSPAAVF